MSNQMTLGEFLFKFVSDTSSLEEGNEAATKSSEELARKVERISISNDNLSRKMTQMAQIMMQSANASEWLASKQNRVADTNEAVAAAMGGLTDKFDEFTDAQAKAREEAEKNDKEREKQGRGVDKFTKKLLALAGAYFTVSRIQGGFQKNFEQNLELAKFTELLGVNANDVKNWARIVEREGGKASDVFESFQNISIQLGQIDVTGEGGELLQAVNKLGIKIKDELGENLDPDEILLNFSDALLSKNLDKELALFVAGQFGISDDVLRLLNQGRADIESMLSKQRVSQFQFEEGDLGKIKELNAALVDVKLTADSLFTEISLENLEKVLWILDQVERSLNIIRGKEDVDLSLGSAFESFQSFIDESFMKGHEEERQKFFDRKNQEEFLKEREGEEAYLRENGKKFINQQFMEDRESEEDFLRENGRKFLESQKKEKKFFDPNFDVMRKLLGGDTGGSSEALQAPIMPERINNILQRQEIMETINTSPLNVPSSNVNNQQTSTSTFDFRGMIIQAPSADAEDIAGTIETTIRRVIGDEFNSVSENLGNSVLG